MKEVQEQTLTNNWWKLKVNFKDIKKTHQSSDKANNK